MRWLLWGGLPSPCAVAFRWNKCLGDRRSQSEGEGSGGTQKEHGMRLLGRSICGADLAPRATASESIGASERLNNPCGLRRPRLEGGSPGLEIVRGARPLLKRGAMRRMRRKEWVKGRRRDVDTRERGAPEIVVKTTPHDSYPLRRRYLPTLTEGLVLAMGREDRPNWACPGLAHWRAETYQLGMSSCLLKKFLIESNRLIGHIRYVIRTSPIRTQ